MLMLSRDGSRYIITAQVEAFPEVDRDQFLRGARPVVMSLGTVVEVAQKDGQPMRITSVSPLHQPST
jgi:hypothetical protein